MVLVPFCKQHILALPYRFGEESLHSCEVMLKDVEDSKRVNNGISSDMQRRKDEKVRHITHYTDVHIFLLYNSILFFICAYTFLIS